MKPTKSKANKKKILNDIVKRQIISQYIEIYGNDRPLEKWNLQACLEVFSYFYSKYRETFGREHPKLTNASIRAIIESFGEATEPDAETQIPLKPSVYPYLIDRYFEQDFTEDCNYSISHFMSGKIRLLRYLEALY